MFIFRLSLASIYASTSCCIASPVSAAETGVKRTLRLPLSSISIIRLSSVLYFPDSSYPARFVIVSCICRIIFSLNDIWSCLECISSSASLYPAISRSSWLRGALSPSTICFIRASVVTIPSIALEPLTDCTLAIFSSSVYILLLLSLRVSDIALNAVIVAVRLTISAGNKPSSKKE